MTSWSLTASGIGKRRFSSPFPTPPRLITSLWPWPFRRCSIFCANGRTMFTGAALPHHVRVLWDEAANTGQVPSLEKLVAVIRSREVSLCLFLSAVRAVQGHLQGQRGNDLRQHGQRDLPGRAGKLHHQGNFRELAGKGHDLHADRGPLPWTVGKLQPEHPAAGPGADDPPAKSWLPCRATSAFCSYGGLPRSFRPNTI